jgi:hypothetical protein
MVSGLFFFSINTNKRMEIMSNYTKQITDRTEMAEFIAFRFGMTFEQAKKRVEEQLGPEDNNEVND